MVAAFAAAAIGVAFQERERFGEGDDLAPGHRGREFSTHGETLSHPTIAAGVPNWEAAMVIMRFAPAITMETARKMVDYMLELVIARHGAWFWSGLQGKHTLKYG